MWKRPSEPLARSGRPPSLSVGGVGAALVLLVAVTLLAPPPIRAEAEPVSSFTTMQQLVEGSAALVLGRTLAIEQGPTLQSDGSWFEGARAIFAIERVLWAREPTEASVTLDGLTRDDLPPVGRTAAVFLTHDPEAEEGHRRLAAAGSMVVSQGGVATISDRSPGFFRQFAGMQFADALARLVQLTSVSADSPATERDLTIDPSLILVIAAAGAVVLGAALTLQRGRRGPSIRNPRQG